MKQILVPCDFSSSSIETFKNGCCLDYLRDADVPYDDGMENALTLIADKRRADGSWSLQEKHKGKVHFDMEKTGTSSRWNTLRCLRVLKHFGRLKD